jgi:hypothetical protein
MFQSTVLVERDWGPVGVLALVREAHAKSLVLVNRWFSSEVAAHGQDLCVMQLSLFTSNHALKNRIIRLHKNDGHEKPNNSFGPNLSIYPVIAPALLSIWCLYALSALIDCNGQAKLLCHGMQNIRS